MTGIIVGEKSQAGQVNPVSEEMSSLNRHQKSSKSKAVILSAVLSAVVTACLATTVFMSIYYTSVVRRNDSDEQKEWISWTRIKDGKIVHESALFDSDSRTGLMVSAESYKIGEDNSIALHDFGKGIVAIRDFRTNTCYVSDIKIPDFDTAKRMIETRRGKQLPIQELVQARVRPMNMTTEDLGPKLTSFCDGAESHWFDFSQGNDKVEKRRAIESIGPFRLPPHVACYIIRVDLEEISPLSIEL